MPNGRLTSEPGPTSRPNRHAGGRTCLVTLFALASLATVLGSLSGSGVIA